MLASIFMSDTHELIEEVLGLVEGAKNLDEAFWIKKAIKKPGALHKQLGVSKDKKIPVSTLKKASHAGGKEGKRARLALTLRKLRKKKG